MKRKGLHEDDIQNLHITTPELLTDQELFLRLGVDGGDVVNNPPGSHEPNNTSPNPPPRKIYKNIILGMIHTKSLRPLSPPEFT